MKLELKKLKVVTALSSETDCFTAELWINGLYRGDISNDGQGGCHRFPYGTAEDEVEAYAATLPPHPKYGKETADSLVTKQLIDAMHWNQELRLCRKNKVTVFTISTRPDSYQINHTPFSPENKALILKAHPDAVFINEKFAEHLKPKPCSTKTPKRK